jgi:uncharacterized membrane protein YdbT with pleckstrin-like domain
MQLTEQLVPEFLFETSRRTQPKESAVPTIGYKAFLAAISAIVGVSVYLFATSTFDVSRLAFANYILYGFCAIMCVAIPAVLIVHGMLAQGNREFEMGRDTFIFVTGAYDRQTDFMRYDKVQIATVTSGIVQRRFGVGRCTVSLMSSRGAVSVKSGIFLRDDLELVGNEVVARIEDGRYDYRMYL